VCSLQIFLLVSSHNDDEPMSAAVTAPPCHSRPSPLNPNSRATPSPSSNGKPNAVSATRRHLANLDRLFVKPPPLPLPLPPQPRKLPIEVPGDGEATPDDRSGHGGLLNALNLSTLLPFTRKAAVDAGADVHASIGVS
jgi:hypothetical protein